MSKYGMGTPANKPCFHLIEYHLVKVVMIKRTEKFNGKSMEHILPKAIDPY